MCLSMQRFISRRQSVYIPAVALAFARVGACRALLLHLHCELRRGIYYNDDESQPAIVSKTVGRREVAAAVSVARSGCFRLPPQRRGSTGGTQSAAALFVLRPDSTPQGSQQLAGLERVLHESRPPRYRAKGKSGKVLLQPGASVTRCFGPHLQCARFSR